MPRSNDPDIRRIIALPFVLAVAFAGALRAADEKEDEATGLYRRAMQNAEYYDFEGSIPLLDRLIELKPDFADAWHQRGVAKVMSKMYEQAIPDLDQAIK